MISLPNAPKLTKSEGNKAYFEIGPLYPGYGVTLGNSLRRVLLSSLEGAAMTSVKINGASHQFSALENVLEDVVDIMLNLKKIRFKVENQESEEPIKVEFETSGEKEIKAGDIKTPTGLDIINKDEHIATLTNKKAKFSMEFEVQKGTGYVPSEQLQQEKLPIGMIALDAAFSPIKFVNYTIENIRMGQRTDYNKLVIEIETDGSINPALALEQASQILIDHFSIVKNVESIPAINPNNEKTKKKRKLE